ncbi:calcium-binding protein [Pararoseomonas sp. SCSIO 73927]|uniref:calcium-binding protein n=1 Tax=Pararoseomonas sp. SCSIO 73927 TaxID=3114537 RepID=UPI0030CA9BE3
MAVYLNPTSAITGTRGTDLFLLHDAAGLAAAGALDGGRGLDAVILLSDAALTDAHFAGLRNMEGLMLGGTGAQSLVLGPRAAAAFTGGTIAVLADAALSASIDGTALGAGTALLAATGAGADTLAGGAGNDILHAAGGEDRLLGGAGNDRLWGGAGADLLYGGAGDDTLSGGEDADCMTGGAGADRFRYAAPAEGGDTTTDFAPGTDILEVSAAGFGGGLVAGGDATGHFTANTAARADSSSGTGQFIFETDAARLWWDADGAGGSAAVLIATLPGAALSAGDIHILG